MVNNPGIIIGGGAGSMIGETKNKQQPHNNNPIFGAQTNINNAQSGIQLGGVNSTTTSFIGKPVQQPIQQSTPFTGNFVQGLGKQQGLNTSNVNNMAFGQSSGFGQQSSFGQTSSFAQVSTFGQSSMLGGSGGLKPTENKGLGSSFGGSSGFGVNNSNQVSFLD